MKRIFGTGRYANVTATVALVVALGGTSYAAVKLSANSVTSKHVKNNSLLKKDFKAGQLAAGPAGARGAAGANGAPGAAGAKGDTGSQGPGGANGVTPDGFSASTPGTVGLSTSEITVQTVSLPAGKYIISAKSMANNTNPDAVNGDVNVRCRLSAGGSDIDSLGGVGTDIAPAAPPLSDTTISLSGGATLGSAGAATLLCTAAAATGTYHNRTITAVKVGTLNGS